jgi:multidrug transporter EmrE-like cation transporter
MATFHLSFGVVCVALVSHFILGERLSATQLVGFGLLVVATVLITRG